MAKNHKKRPKPGSSSSVDEEDMATSNCESLRSSIDILNKVVTDGFTNIHSDIDNLRLQLKTEIDGIKRTIKDIEKSLESTQEEVEVVKEDVKKVTEDLSKSTNTLNEKIVKLEQFSKSPEVTEALNAKIAELETQLKQQIEDNISDSNSILEEKTFASTTFWKQRMRTANQLFKTLFSKWRLIPLQYGTMLCIE